MIFSTVTASYGEAVVKQIDPTRRIKTRLYRDECTPVADNLHKDLTKLGRPMEDIILLEWCPYGNEKNSVPVSHWAGDKYDHELNSLTPILTSMSEMRDVR